MKNITKLYKKLMDENSHQNISTNNRSTCNYMYIFLSKGFSGPIDFNFVNELSKLVK